MLAAEPTNKQPYKYFRCTESWKNADEKILAGDQRATNFVNWAYTAYGHLSDDANYRILSVARAATIGDHRYLINQIEDLLPKIVRFPICIMNMI